MGWVRCGTDGLYGDCRVIRLESDLLAIDVLPELGGDGFDYLWTLHPALAVTGSQRLVIPCEKGIIQAPVGGRLLSTDCEFLWPLAPGARGGRGLHVLALEPSTGYPYDLDRASAAGRCARLNGGDVLETRTTAVILTGCDDVRHIGIDGRVA